MGGKFTRSSGDYRRTTGQDCTDSSRRRRPWDPEKLRGVRARSLSLSGARIEKVPREDSRPTRSKGARAREASTAAAAAFTRPTFEIGKLDQVKAENIDVLREKKRVRRWLRRTRKKLRAPRKIRNPIERASRKEDSASRLVYTESDARGGLSRHR